MADRPYTVLSCSMSLDGYISGPSGTRLMLSNAADFDRVDEVRASCDAILVGAGTIRNDDPRLLIRDEDRRAERSARGLAPSPVKVTVTAEGGLDPCARFFADGDGEKLVYCATDAIGRANRSLGSAATIVDAGSPVDLDWVVTDLGARGVRRLMVEGGGSMHTQFLAGCLADELQLVIAPFFVGDSRAQRFVTDGSFPFHPGRRAELAEVRQIGDVVLMRYALTARYSSA
jgi:5-amino-6-(5-phosphoribosylamino)uracil reductase